MTPALQKALDLHQPLATQLPQFPTEEEKAAVRTLNRVRASLLDDDWPKKIAAFRALYSLAQHDREVPGPLSGPRFMLHMRLLAEEWKETVDAVDGLRYVEDPIDEAVCFAEWVDGILDLIYVGIGALCESGFTPQEINLLMTEVHASNLTKVDEHGKPIYDEGGKVLKGEHYVKADIAALIAQIVEARRG
jgi:hypothetical protein